MIGFVDSDDWINPGVYQKLFDIMKEYDADISQVGYVKEYVGRKSVKHLVKATEVISGKAAIRAVSYGRFPNFACNKLHKRKVINCEFPVGRSFEDIYVYGHWLKTIDRMVIDPAPLYHYRMRKGSIVHSNVAKNRYDFFLSSIESMQAVEEAFDDEKALFKKNAFINKAAIHAAKNIARREKDKSKRDETVKRISREVRKYELPPLYYTGIKQWWRVKLLVNHPELFITLMRWVNIFDLDVRDREKRYYD